MALIACKNCGKQLSDKAPACPHCGAPQTPVTAAPQPDAAAPRRLTGKQKKLILGVCAAAVLVVVVAVLASSLLGDKSSGGKADADVPAGAFADTLHTGAPADDRTEDLPPAVETPQPIPTYAVTLDVDCVQNIAFNTYDVDILLDGEPLDTLAHGESKIYTGDLEEGKHTVEFRINGETWDGEAIYDPDDSGTFQRFSFTIDRDTAFSFRIHLTAGNDIEVESP